ncbi:MAG: hypothetical protein MR021_07515 [Clostridiales bacterium]|nr:hypothetical protein [Clostridiales bacterium]
MPLNIDFTQVLLHMLNFVILAGGLTLLVFKPVSRFLEDRRARLAGQEQENARKAEELDQLKAEYTQRLAQADADIAARRQQAEKDMGDAARAYLDDAKAKADACLAAAEQEAEERKQHILESVQTDISELVLSAAQKLLSDTVTPERDRDLYDAFIRRAQEDVANKRSDA